MRIKIGEVTGDISSCHNSASKCGSVHNAARRWTIPVDTVGSRAEDGDVLASDFTRACQRELLIAPADSALSSHFYRDFPARNQAYARIVLTRFALTKLADAFLALCK